MKLTTTTDRKTGKLSILVGPDVHPNKHAEPFNELAAKPANDLISEVTRWVPERTVRFTTTTEQKARAKAQADWLATEEKRKAEKLAAIAQRKVPTSVPSPGPKTMRTVTKTIAAFVLAIIALAFATPAQAQRYGPPVTLWSWKALVGPTNLVGTDPAVYGTLYNSGVVDGSKQDKVAIQVNFNYNTNTVTTNGIAWVRSIDQSTWDTNNIVLTYFHQTAAPAAGGGAVWATNLTMNGFGYYKFLFWTNSGYGAAATVWPTNITVRWVPKLAAP